MSVGKAQEPGSLSGKPAGSWWCGFLLTPRAGSGLAGRQSPAELLDSGSWHCDRWQQVKKGPSSEGSKNMHRSGLVCERAVLLPAVAGHFGALVSNLDTVIKCVCIRYFLCLTDHLTNSRWVFERGIF